jgi:glycosyltransferase involved in cell wall biosynthesis
VTNLFCTADPIGKSDHGGGRLAQHELQALNDLGDDVDVINPPMQQDAFAADEMALSSLPNKVYKIAHFYSQTYSKTIATLKARGTKTSYTCPAHDVSVSRSEHDGMGMGFNFPHLTEPSSWERYHQGYKDCDVLIAQSTYSKGVLREQGCTQRIEVVHPGIVFPGNVQAAPQFAVGFLGSCGPDKGVRYLIEAWDKLYYSDATLILAGRQAEALLPLIRQARGSYYLQGYVEDIADFYNLISVYVQPSCTESWGLEVTEAMAWGRPVICTRSCGAADAVESGHNGFVIEPRDVGTLATLINVYKNNPSMVQKHGEAGKVRAQRYTWERCREQLIEIWKSL